MTIVIAGIGFLVWWFNHNAAVQANLENNVTPTVIPKNPPAEKTNTIESLQLPQTTTPQTEPTYTQPLQTWEPVDPPLLKVTQVPPDKLPGNFFPTNIPREDTIADVNQNYVVFTAKNQYQATRGYRTTKSLDSLMAVYRSYFMREGWHIVSAISQTKLQSIAAQKPQTQIQVSMSENSITGEKTVDISFSFDENLR